MVTSAPKHEKGRPTLDAVLVRQLFLNGAVNFDDRYPVNTQFLRGFVQLGRDLFAVLTPRGVELDQRQLGLRDESGEVL